MAPIFRLFVPLSTAALLSACAANIGEAERAPPPGNAFAAELQKGYVALARAEQDENDFADARAFAEKARAAAAGKPLPPESLGARKLPSESVPALVDARARLVRALEAGAADGPATAQPAARAQLGFDCWIQEQEENFQRADIETCRTGFETAMADIERRMTAAAPSTSPAARLPVAPAAFAAPEPETSALETRFVVYFDFDRSAISAATAGELSRAAAAARRTGAALVRIVGHADRAGSEEHNRSLSRDRARAVADALRSVGLPDVGVAVLARGEDEPAVRTADGIRDARNRRVEIELTH
jgi:OOP family OmpA-OmpF porin